MLLIKEKTKGGIIYFWDGMQDTHLLTRRTKKEKGKRGLFDLNLKIFSKRLGYLNTSIFSLRSSIQIKFLFLELFFDKIT